MKTVDEIIDEILKAEGGFQKMPEDSGNWVGEKLIGTNYGITPKALASWRGVRPEEITEQDILELEVSEARDIYRNDYYEAPQISALPDDLRPLLTDMAVNHGPKAAIRMLQQTVEKAGWAISVDGVIGPQTINMVAVAAAEMGSRLTDAVVFERKAFFDRIIERRPQNQRFKRGWHLRAEAFLVGSYA